MPQETIEDNRVMLDRRSTAHSISAQLERLQESMDSLRKAFPDGDIEGHRRVHELGETFYHTLTLQPQLDKGRTVSGSTIEWWMKQSDEARSALFGMTLEEPEDALRKFYEFVGSVTMKVWGNGAAFDNVIVTDLYADFDMTRPWGYRGDMCYRTVVAEAYARNPDLKNLWVKPTVAHNALDDAKAQAFHLQQIWAARKTGEA